VLKAVNISDHRVAACKLIRLTEGTSEKDRKNVEKEMRIHAALKHANVLEFLNAVVVELKHQATYVPGIYMLLEFGGGGDLFDKIGNFFHVFSLWTALMFFFVVPAPDVGVREDVAQLYFNQLIAGMVSTFSCDFCLSV
jgi:serine/threonine-protein kinase CHEK1